MYVSGVGNDPRDRVFNVKLQAERYDSDGKFQLINNSIENAISKLNKQFTITHVYSHQETGILSTFKRDIAFASYCKKEKIVWIENQNNAIIRGISNRNTWFEDWNTFMNINYHVFLPKENQLLTTLEIKTLETHFKISNQEFIIHKYKCKQEKQVLICFVFIILLKIVLSTIP
eukprot:maker-scaffold2057_size21725-snap-gene-0.0 protein:Tk06638 transcript:maker-scaffold2057_size21725-snap-gene-0.0-mRNA-1 annotation:"fad-binding protein"